MGMPPVKAASWIAFGEHPLLELYMKVTAVKGEPMSQTQALILLCLENHAGSWGQAESLTGE